MSERRALEVLDELLHPAFRVVAPEEESRQRTHDEIALHAEYVAEKAIEEAGAGALLAARARRLIDSRTWEELFRSARNYVRAGGSQ